MCNPFAMLRVSPGARLGHANINHGRADKKEMAYVNPVLSACRSRLFRPLMQALVAIAVPRLAHMPVPSRRYFSARSCLACQHAIDSVRSRLQG